MLSVFFFKQKMIEQLAEEDKAEIVSLVDLA